MTIPELKPSMRPTVGKYYLVPCVRATNDSGVAGLHTARGVDGWIPVIGPEHHDRQTIGFNAMHLHIDVRFVSAAVVRRYSTWREGVAAVQSLMGHPFSTFSDGVGEKPVKVERSLRKMRCHREAPEFPVSAAIKWHRQLEDEQALCRLKQGHICPHRGFDLTPFIKEDGTVVCPGHGLRWNTKTGELIRHQDRDLESRASELSLFRS